MQYNLPTCNELAGLIIGDFGVENYKRDVIVDSMEKGLHHVSSLHPAFMPLQYPLLFPYGRRGFQLGIPHRDIDLSHSIDITSDLPVPEGRSRVSMVEYYCYCCHYKKKSIQSVSLLRKIIFTVPG